MPTTVSIPAFARHIVVVTDRVVIETPDTAITQEYMPGIYSFFTQDSAKRFTKVVNSAIDDTIVDVAHHFVYANGAKMPTIQKETNHDHDCK